MLLLSVLHTSSAEWSQIVIAYTIFLLFLMNAIHQCRFIQIGGLKTYAFPRCHCLKKNCFLFVPLCLKILERNLCRYVKRKQGYPPESACKLGGNIMLLLLSIFLMEQRTEFQNSLKPLLWKGHRPQLKIQPGVFKNCPYSSFMQKQQNQILQLFIMKNDSKYRDWHSSQKGCEGPLQ